MEPINKIRNVFIHSRTTPFRNTIYTLVAGVIRATCHLGHYNARTSLWYIPHHPEHLRFLF
jgi:hypothetical protein